jgi:hypothetical protein
MKYASLLLLVLVACSVLVGCSTTSSRCGCVQANCCSWDWYQPCDLIEGRTCGEPACRPGVVVSRCYAVPAPVVTDAAPAEPAAP